MRIAGVITFLLLLGGGAMAATGNTRDAYFHSDLPLERSDGQTVWPHYCVYQRDDVVLGGECIPFATGDWEWLRTACPWVFDVCGHFVRLGSDGDDYTYDDADDRRDLVGRGTPSWIFKLEADDASHLYALQIGYRGGSRYILLSATPDGDGIFKKMAVLDAHCLPLAGVQARHPPPAPYDDGDDEAYCAVNAMASLIAIAKEAQSRPPAATMTYLGPVPDDTHK